MGTKEVQCGWLKEKRGRTPLPTSRRVSNVVHATPSVKPDNDVSASLALFYFMQFIDHDLTDTPKGNTLYSL